MLGYDPEAIYQDADIEMMELAEAADRADDPEEVCYNYTPPSWDPLGPCRNCYFAERSHL